MNIKRCFNKANLNCLRLALLILIYGSLQAFWLSICILSYYHFPIPFIAVLKKSSLVMKIIFTNAQTLQLFTTNIKKEHIYKRY